MTPSRIAMSFVGAVIIVVGVGTDVLDPEDPDGLTVTASDAAEQVVVQLGEAAPSVETVPITAPDTAITSGPAVAAGPTIPTAPEIAAAPTIPTAPEIAAAPTIPTAPEIAAAAASSTTAPPTTAPPPTAAPSTTSPPTTTTSPPTTTTTTTAPPVELPVPAPAPTVAYFEEELVDLGRISIPTLGIDRTLHQGISLYNIDRGPSHWPGTAEPGELGNVVVAGHRTTHGGPFRGLDQLVEGDEVIFEVDGEVHVYVVTGTEVVLPTGLHIVEQTEAHTATLFACHPPGSAEYRYVVHLELDPLAGVDTELASA